MSTVGVTEVGAVEPELVEVVCRFVARTFQFDARRVSVEIDLDAARDENREQMGSHVIMGQVQKQTRSDGSRLLGLTEHDLFLPMLSFVFGHAQLEGPVALVSLARLRQEFYGLSPDSQRLEKRLQTEVAHELGHTFGLHHCADRRCCMSLSTSIEEVDDKEPSFCRSCRVTLREWRAAHPPESRLEPQSEGTK